MLGILAEREPGLGVVFGGGPFWRARLPQRIRRMLLISLRACLNVYSQFVA